jgi:dihydroorotate dehydrogenase (fumarate)
MAHVSTTYLGLALKNPIIVGSSGLTDSVDRIKGLEDNGAAAVVLRSIFEEEIAFEFEEVLKEAAPGSYNTEYLEYFDYYDYQIREEHLRRYIKLIRDSKKRVSIPVIASVNCTYSHEWALFARELESAGADALELNMFFLPTDFARTAEEREQAYFDIIESVKSATSIPVALKISYYFSNLGPMIRRLSNTGVSGLVLFNRFWSPDFDIDTLEVVPTNVLSTPAELAVPLRWIAVMAERVDCDLAASTGVHDGKAVIKQILAGAKAVQVVSALYKHGSGHIQEMLNELETWMASHGYDSLDQFRGKMSQARVSDPAAYERVQFMKYFGGRRQTALERSGNVEDST